MLQQRTIPFFNGENVSCEAVTSDRGHLPPYFEGFEQLFRGYRVINHMQADNRAQITHANPCSLEMERMFSSFDSMLTRIKEDPYNTSWQEISYCRVLDPVVIQTRHGEYISALVHMSSSEDENLIPTSKGIEVLTNAAVVRMSARKEDLEHIVTEVLHDTSAFNESAEHLIDFYNGSGSGEGYIELEQGLSPSEPGTEFTKCPSFLEDNIAAGIRKLIGDQVEVHLLNLIFRACGTTRFSAVVQPHVWSWDAGDNEFFGGVFIRNPGSTCTAPIRLERVPDRLRERVGLPPIRDCDLDAL